MTGTKTTDPQLQSGGVDLPPSASIDDSQPGKSELLPDGEQCLAIPEEWDVVSEGGHIDVD